MKNCLFNRLSRILIISVITTLLLITAPCFGDTQDAGRVSCLKGKVTRISDQGDSPLRLFAAVSGGDRIRVEKDSHCRILFYSDYHEESITGVVSVTGAGCVPVKGSSSMIEITRKPPRFTLPSKVSGGGRSVAADITRTVSLMKGGEVITPIANILDEKKSLTFTWKPLESEHPRYYYFVLEKVKETKSTRIKEQLLETNSLTLDTANSIIPGNLYRCNVSAYLSIPPKEEGFDRPDNLLGDNSQSPYTFMMPSASEIGLIKESEEKLKGMGESDPEWIPSAFYLLNLYMEYGVLDRAGRLAGQMSRLVKENEVIDGLRRLYDH